MRGLLPIIVSTALLGGCSSDETEPLFGSSHSTSGSGHGGGGGVCSPGVQISCACAGGVSGTQVCKADGSGFGACACGDGGAGAGASGGGGAGASGGGTGGGTFCAPGSTTSCYSGPIGTDGVGLCVAGAQTCLPDGSSYGACVGEVVPTAETCASPGDDDCDGETNEEGPDCGCVPGSQQSCYSGPPATEDVGPCHGGAQQCKPDGTGYGPCVGEITPQPETCNTPGDDDCDGQTNEDGAGCVCVPSSTSACYDGPNGTENVGTCKGGTKTCNGQGTAYGPCVGEVVPGQDLCATAADEDCNGSPIPCVTNATWSKAFGSSGVSTYPYGLAVDGAGNIVVLLYANGPIDFGGGPLVGLVLLKLDGAGNHLWSKSFTDSTGWVGLGVDPGGNVLLTGGFVGTVSYGGAALVNGGSQMNLFVVKLDGQGNHVWSKQFGVSGQQSYATSIAADSTGAILVGGRFYGTTDFGGGPLVPPNFNNGDIFFLELTAAGAHTWSKQAHSEAGYVDGVSVDGLGNSVFTGWFATSIDVGSGVVNGAGGNDIFAVRLGPTGAPLFAKVFGDAGAQIECHSALDAAGNVLLTGRYPGTLDFGGGPLLATGPSDIFAAKLDTTGGHVWSKTFGNGQNQLVATGVTADPVGNALFTGGFAGAIDFGAGSVANAGNGDVYVPKYSAAGTPMWTHAYGDGADQYGSRIATDGVGAPVVLGALYGAADFGQGALVPVGGPDVFLAKLAP